MLFCRRIHLCVRCDVQGVLRLWTHEGPFSRSLIYKGRKQGENFVLLFKSCLRGFFFLILELVACAQMSIMRACMDDRLPEIANAAI